MAWQDVVEKLWKRLKIRIDFSLWVHYNLNVPTKKGGLNIGYSKRNKIDR